MKTYEELQEHYWSVIVPMARKHGIKPWECVRLKENPLPIFNRHPDFSAPYVSYKFAITILEGKPVFINDRIWHKDHGETEIVCGDSLIRNIGMYTTIPPTKKRTFMLNGVELPCPEKDIRFKFYIGTDGAQKYFSFDRKEDRDATLQAVIDLLTEARDKE